MSKLYQRIQINTAKYFHSQLPLTTNELRTGKNFIQPNFKLENNKENCSVFIF